MDYKEFCSEIDNLNIANISAFRYLHKNIIYDYSLIKQEIEHLKVFSKPIAIDNYQYDKALAYFRKINNNQFDYKDLQSLANYFSWESYISRFIN